MPASLYSRRLPAKPRWNAAAVVGALALHALLVAGLWQTWHASRDARAPWSPMSVRLMREEPAPVVSPVPPEEKTVATPPSRPPRRKPAKPDARGPSDVPSSAILASPAAESTTPPASTTPESSTADKLPFIDPDSITRAARSVARGTTLARESDRLIAKRDAPTAQERLAAGVASGARKDCLKGSLDGNGGYQPRIGGLFEIPFLAYDAITGKCRR